MKYIKTSSSIFEVVEETDLIYRVRAKHMPNKIYSKSNCQTEVLGESDELIYLINRIVIFNTNCSARVIYLKNQFEKLSYKEIMNDIRNGHKKVFGYIWFYLPCGAPRLEPVAELTKEGEWKLL